MSDDDDMITGRDGAKGDVSVEGSSDKVKRLKTEDSGVSVDAGTSTSSEEQPGENSTASTSFPKATNSKKRNYRKATDGNDNSPDEVIEESPAAAAPDAQPEAPEEQRSGRRPKVWYLNFDTHSNSSTDDDHDSNMSRTYVYGSESESEVEDPPVLSKEKPKHKWFMVPEIANRQIGSSGHYKSSELFQRRCYGSLHSVQRLELMYKLEKHEGCVNSLNFHPNGELLASGSDDLSCVVWDWPTGKDLITFDTKHRGNVFQSKFLPLSGDLHIVTCARDGQVSCRPTFGLSLLMIFFSTAYDDRY